MSAARMDVVKRPVRAAVYTGTRNVYESMLTASKSLIANAAIDKVYFLIEDDEFPSELPPIVETRNISGQEWFPEGGPNYGNRWTYMILVRAAFSKLFPELDTILSLDVDTIVTKDISDLWELPVCMDDFYVAACREPKKSDGMLYFNAGVMLLNLKKLRETGMDDLLIIDLNANRYGFCEQDCMNKHFQRHILKIPAEYNANAFTEETKTIRVMHYAAVRDWSGMPLVTHYRDMDWKEVLERRQRMLSAIAD